MMENQEKTNEATKETKVEETKAELYAALAKAQETMSNAKFNKTNPHFRNNYADLASIMDACRKPLSKNGLCILQIIKTDETGQMHLITRLAHSSGQFIESSFILRAEKNTIQGLGSAITYAKRYSLSSLLGVVADDDDDAEIASKEEAQFITPEQVKELSTQFTKLKNGDRAIVIKAIGTGNLSLIKADKYESVCKLIENTVKRRNEENNG